jgi:DNA-binding CsgD family transcriptional regulator/PAS domain-containing protein
VHRRSQLDAATDWAITTRPVRGTGPSSLVQELAHEVYDAIGNAGAWETFLEKLASALGGIMPGIFASDRPTDKPQLTLAPDADDASTRAYQAYYCRLDMRRPRIQALPAGTVFVGQQLLPDHELEQSEFYNDFLRPRGLYHIAGGVALKDERQIAVLRVIRTREAGGFERRHVKLLHQLLPHVSRALRLHQQLALARTRADAGSAIMDRFPAGVIVLDAQGAVVATNETADALLARDDGLVIRRGRLTAATAAEAAALAGLVGAAVRRQGSDGAMVASRPSGLRPLMLRIEPLPLQPELDPTGRGAVMVLVSDPERRTGPPTTLLTRYFGLTPAEARVATRIAQGKDVVEVAHELGVEPETTRTQLKRIFVKTRTHRQADLVRLVLSVPVRDAAAATDAAPANGERRLARE